ncbi:hypothetical protein BDV93DRAFT_603928 [Ceratobasidium sp. AG-I]|nr:hypothetical protein BDV93DRAFT_603928 [Ceratobasidium sp. AG-I]
MSFNGSHRSSASLSANQPPLDRAPSPFANKLRLNSPAGSLLPPIPPPAPLGLPDLETISLGSMSSKPTPIPHRRSTSPLRPQVFDRSMDPEVEDDEEIPWGERPSRTHAESPTQLSPTTARFASTFATRINSLFAPEAPGSTPPRGRMTDAELEAEAERAREASRREAERILTEEAAERRRAEERALAIRAQQRAQAQLEQQQRALERAQLGRPVTPTRGMGLEPVTSPKKEKEGENSWWGMAKSKLTPTREKEKELTPAQQIATEARNKEKEQEKEKEKQKDKGKKSGEWPAQPGVRSTDPTLLAMAAVSQMATSPVGSTSNHFMSGGLATSPGGYPSYSPRPIMPHEQLAREIEAQGGGRANGDLFSTRHSTDGLLGSSPKTPLPFASRATPSPAPSPLQPARAQTNPAQMGLSNSGTPLVGRSPNTSPDKSPNADKDKRLNTLDSDKRTNTSSTMDDGSPPLYAQFTPTGALDVPLTLLTVARRFEKLEKWTVGHVRALEERMKDVERYLVDKDSKADVAGKEIGLLKAGIQDIRRSVETLREAIPTPAMLQTAIVPVTPARNSRVTEVAHDSDTVTARSRAMSANSASSYATAISVLSGDTSNTNAVRASVISLGSVEADGIEVRPSVAEVVTPLATRQPLPSAPSTSHSLSDSISTSISSIGLGSPPLSTSTSRSFALPESGSREFKPVPASAKEFSPPPPQSRVSSLTSTRPQSPPTGLRSRLPYPTGDYTSLGQPVTPLAATAASFPMPPGASSSSVTLAAGGSTAPLSIRSVDREKEKEKERERESSDMSTPLAVPPSRAPRAESTSPTPRKRYTVALSGRDQDQGQPISSQTAMFTSTPLLTSDPTSPVRTSPTANRTRSQSTYGFQPPASPSPSPATTAGRLRRAVSSSNDGSGGLAAVFAQTEDWEDVRDKVLSPRLANGSGESKFVDPLVIRRKGAGAGGNTNGNGAKPAAGAGRGKVPISQLVKFFDGDK